MEWQHRHLTRGRVGMPAAWGCRQGSGDAKAMGMLTSWAWEAARGVGTETGIHKRVRKGLIDDESSQMNGAPLCFPPSAERRPNIPSSPKG